MGKIATEQESFSIGKKGTSAGNKLCTKSRAEALGCKVKGTYQSNQCVQLSDLESGAFITVTPSYLFEYGTRRKVFSLNVKSSSDWSLRIQIDTKPVKGAITSSKAQGPMGESSLNVTVVGRSVDNPGGTIEYFCGGTITFTNSEGSTQRVSVELDYLP